MATTKKDPFGGKQAKPFGQKDDDKDDKAKKAPAKKAAKKTSRGK
jgi:hypothetical protein